MKRANSLPPAKVETRQSTTDNSALGGVPVFCGHLWKKSPGVNLLSKGYRWRYVVLLKGKMGWWTSEKYALQEDAKGFVDFAVDACDVLPDDPESRTRFSVKPRTRRWSQGQVFTGATEGRTFIFDAEGSEHHRAAWLSAVNAHIEFGVRKRRQSTARISLVQLSHSAADVDKLQEAIKESQEAGVEEATIERANLILSKVMDHHKAVDDLLNPKQARVEEFLTDKTPAAAQQAELAIGSISAPCPRWRRPNGQLSGFDNLSQTGPESPMREADSFPLEPDMESIPRPVSPQRREPVRKPLFDMDELDPAQEPDPSDADEEPRAATPQLPTDMPRDLEESSSGVPRCVESESMEARPIVAEPVGVARSDQTSHGAPEEESVEGQLAPASRQDSRASSGSVSPDSIRNNLTRIKAKLQERPAHRPAASDEPTFDYGSSLEEEASPRKTYCFKCASRHDPFLQCWEVGRAKQRDHLAEMYMENMRMGIRTSISASPASFNEFGSESIRAPSISSAQAAPEFSPAERPTSSSDALPSDMAVASTAGDISAPGHLTDMTQSQSAGDESDMGQSALAGIQAEQESTEAINEASHTSGGEEIAADSPECAGDGSTARLLETPDVESSALPMTGAATLPGEFSDDSSPERPAKGTGMRINNFRSLRKQRSLPPPRRRHSEPNEEGTPLWLELRAKLEKRRSRIDSIEIGCDGLS